MRVRGRTAAFEAPEKNGRPLFSQLATTSKVVLAGLASTAPAHIGAGDICLVVLRGREIGRTTTSRQVAGAWTLRDFTTTMQMFEMSVQWRMVQLGESAQLKTTKHLLAYMLGAFAECRTEQSIWVVCFSVNRWVIGRTCLITGPLVTASPLLRDVVRAATLADARGIAVIRTEPSEDVRAKPGDVRLAQQLRTAFTALELEWIDYVIVSTRDDAEQPEYHSFADYE